ncbi:MAG: glycoside hydrolase family 99-like domain-containing protein [Kiritimatiellae bacterium]|nr:glycoside hydrolase family 99-like domain-containing protein [Kiritimatiellia bacterium]
MNSFAADYDIAAYVWPAYHNEPRWKELGIFADGKGEWQNVYEAKPKWKGHHQPLVPLWGYENEADPKVVEKKIDAAVSHGVNVFIYDWYWYGGRPFLEDALNKGFLGAANNGKMKFYLMWANHHVNWLWDNTVADKKWGAPRWRGWVSAEEFKTLTKRWIEKYFSRPNYYRIKGLPVLMIYELSTFVEGVGGVEAAKKALETFRGDCVAAGLGGVHLMVCDFGVKAEQVKRLGLDSATIYNFVHWSKVKGNPDYADWVEQGARRFDVAREKLGVPCYFAHASVGWDTNPRYPVEVVMPTAMNSTPAKFEVALKRAKDWCDRNTPKGYPRLITVNSWNEWTEGSYLEPDERFGFGYLEAIKRVFGKTNEDNK